MVKHPCLHSLVSCLGNDVLYPGKLLNKLLGWFFGGHGDAGCLDEFCSLEEGLNTNQ